VTDDLGVDRIPVVSSHADVTDAYLVAVAKAHGLKLATSTKSSVRRRGQEALRRTLSRVSLAYPARRAHEGSSDESPLQDDGLDLIPADAVLWEH